MTAQQLYDLLTDLQDDGINLSEIHLAYPSQNTGKPHEAIEHTEIVQLPGSDKTEIVFMTDADKAIYVELLYTEFAPVIPASPGDGAVVVEPITAPKWDPDGGKKFHETPPDSNKSMWDDFLKKIMTPILF